CCRSVPAVCRRRGGRLRRVLSHVLDIREPAGSIPRGSVRRTRVARSRLGEAAVCARREDRRRPWHRSMKWAVLPWNKPAVDFYHRLGAHKVTEWDTFELALT